jgi:predicted phage-related tail protein
MLVNKRELSEILGMGKPLMQTVEAIADAMTGQNERLKEFGIKAEAIKGTNRIIYEYTDKHGRQIENYQPGVVLTRRISQEQLLGQL